MKKIALSLSLLAALCLPALVFADPSGTPGSESGTPGSESGNPTQPRDESITLTNPVGGVTSLSGFVYKLINIIVSLSYVAVAFFLLLAGFKFITAQGSSDKLEEAKRTFYWTIVGAILVIGAQVITEVVKSIITQVAKG